MCTFGTAPWGKRHAMTRHPMDHDLLPSACARRPHRRLDMDGKVAFEEHFAIEDPLEHSRSFAGDSGKWDDFTRQLLDLGSERLDHMDEAGIEFALLSLNAPAIQAIPDPKQALQIAQKANEAMANAV